MSNQTHTFDYEMLDDALYIPLVVLGTLSSSLSIVGSSCIIYMALRECRTQVMQRVLLSLSITDLLASCTLLAMPFAIPSFLGLPGAIGNHASCTAAGFLFMVGMKLGAYYNTCLSFYYYLVVRRNWRERNFTRPMEIGAHLVGLLLALSVEIAAVATDSIHPLPGISNVCLYGTWPWACGAHGDIECEHSSPEVVWTLMLFTAPVFLLCSILGFVLTGLVWSTARATLKRSSKYRFENNITSSGTSPMDASNRSHRDEDPNEKKLREVRNQAISYSAAYFNTFLWPFVCLMLFAIVDEGGMVETRRLGTGIYVLQILFWAFFPLQGALNFLVYTRIKVNRWRTVEPEASLLWIYKQVVIGTDIPSRRSKTTSGVTNKSDTNRVKPVSQTEKDSTTHHFGGESSLAISPACQAVPEGPVEDKA